MNKSTFFRKLCLNQMCLWMAYAWLVCGLANAADFLGQSDLIDLLPASTQMLITSQSVKNSCSFIERTDACQQLSGPLWQPVMAKQKRDNVGSLLNPKPWLGLDWQDIREIDHVGAVAAFLDSNGETVFLFLAKLGPNSEKHPFVQRWIANQGGVNQLQSVAGTEPSKLFATKTDGKAGSSVCIAFGPQWTCISSSTKAVQQWLSSATVKSMKASTAPGSDQPVFAAGTWGNGETRFWLSPWAILSGFSKKEPELVRSSKLFGLQGILALSGTLLPPSSTDNSWKLNYNQLLATPLEKGLAMLSFKKGSIVDPPKILTDSMDQVAISYLDMKPWFQGVSHALDQMIDEETPGGFADLVDSILTDPEGPKIDVRKELIYPSGPLMLNFGLTTQDKKNPGQFQHNQVWALSIPDAKKVTTTVNKIFENDQDVQGEQIGSYQVWSTVNDESLFVAVNKGESQTISVAAVDSKYLYLSTDAAWLKGLLRGDSTAVASRPSAALWKSHLQKMNATSFSLLQAINLSSWFQRSWTRLPEPKHKEYISTDLPAFCLTKALVPGCSAADIPKWNQVQTAFGIVTQFAIQNEKGIDGQIRLSAKP